jgi:hypothetical protein
VHPQHAALGVHQPNLPYAGQLADAVHAVAIRPARETEDEVLQIKEEKLKAKAKAKR